MNPPSEPPVQLAQARIVSRDVETIAGFYAELIGSSIPLNEHYVEVPAGPVSIGFSKVQFTEERQLNTASLAALGAREGEIILDFVADDVDSEHARIDGLGVTWVMLPTTQPWGRRSMLFRDPEGHLVNVFSRNIVEPSGT